ncbi:hypothetical protein [Saccharothrix australiensis]|uniref:Uncharacterized protein n=1 Tax=Saccharothrix australiensis TaxID=2072 RepID=A0A495VZT4_9PSEU|nr:hypothetical protein [Saccharothrix australiensis]RKT54951.1 hypothetical protein C8E97_3604 [Saccharothrix australiensis]
MRGGTPSRADRRPGRLRPGGSKGFEGLSRPPDGRVLNSVRTPGRPDENEFITVRPADRLHTDPRVLARR